MARMATTPWRSTHRGHLAVDAGQVVHYIQVEDLDGGATTVPSGGSINPFSFYVGELEEIFWHGF